ncbi:unnamed protein product, partial [Symbiodinium sp. CCMP2456]
MSLVLQAKGISAGHKSTDLAMSATYAQKQPRRGRGTVGPPEFKCTMSLRGSVEDASPELIPDHPPPWLQQVPPGSKLLWTRVFLDGGSEVRESEYGVYHSPQEFLHEALKVTHPFDSAVAIHGPNLRAIAYVLEHGVNKGVEQKRRAVLEHYKALERSLHDEEQRLKQGMDPTVRQVMGSKKLLLFRQMLIDAGVPDENLFNDMVNGFRLTGTLEPSGLFPPKFKPAVISVAELKRSAAWSKHLIEGACRKASRDPDVARAVWKESLEQVGKGWLSGPFTWDQMDEKYGGAWVASKRFGVTQGDKVRAVDDLSQFQVNASVTETEKIQLEGLDDIVVYFESFALPFGASSAVTGCNRAARALRIIMSRLLYLVNTSFFDDYCQMELEGLTDSADYAALELLRLLGWE